jgi:hypothetical protein
MIGAGRLSTLYEIIDEVKEVPLSRCLQDGPQRA